MDKEEFLNLHPHIIMLTALRIHPAPVSWHYIMELGCSDEEFCQLLKEHTLKWKDEIAEMPRGRKTIKNILGIKLKKKRKEKKWKK